MTSGSVIPVQRMADHRRRSDPPVNGHIRAGVEGTIRQTSHVTGIRSARYKGLAKTRLEHAIAGTATNLIRLDAWWTGKPLDRTRTTHLQRLHLTPAA